MAAPHTPPPTTPSRPRSRRSTTAPPDAPPRIRDDLGGNLRPGDPRRFIVEAMVGAMHADGVVDEREKASLRTLLEEHALFEGLPWERASMLIELGVDAIAFAGGARGRVAAIARALPARTHRLAAYAMAAEICAADGRLERAEIDYLEQLRRTFRICTANAESLRTAARNGRAMAGLEDVWVELRSTMPVLVELLLMRRLTVGPVDDDDRRRIGTVVGVLADFAATPPQINDAIAAAEAQLTSARALDSELVRRAAALNDPCDRYWLLVYVLATDRARGTSAWQEVSFMHTLRDAFLASDLEMDAASQHALRLLRSANS